MKTLTPPIPSHEYQFTRRWFLQRNREDFEKYVVPKWAGVPLLTYLEIGVFEGMSVCWMLEHVLKGEGCLAVCCDPHLMTTKIDADEMERVRERAIHNLDPWGHKCLLHRANSYDFLRRCRRTRSGFSGIANGSCDIILIDGNHFDFGCLDDARQCYHLAKPGGWLIFDDVRNQIPKENHVRQALEQWTEEMGDRVQFVASGRYLDIYEKVK